jgi:hypothetical protein
MPLKTLINYFDNNGWPGDVDESKLHERYSISEEPYEKGWDVIEIERHRAILGDTYRKGQPMSAFQTYWMRYAVNPKTKDVKELSERSGEICIDDMSSYVDEILPEECDLSITLLEDGDYLIHDLICNSERIISTIEEAKAFALELVDDLADNFQTRLADEGLPLSDEQLKQLRDEYTENVRYQIIDSVENLWEERELK